VVIRVYQLKNRVNFDNARYEDLFNPVNNTLGAEFIAVDEFLIDPGMNKELDVDVSAATKFVGIAVGYRSDDSVNWRTIVTMPEKAMLDPIGLFSGGGIQIILDELSVRAEDL
jgi:type VI secretion system protein VasD